MLMFVDIKKIKNSIHENWCLEQNDYKSDSLDEQGWEVLLTTSNGYVGLKGSIELPTLHRTPKSFFAGVFDKPDVDVVLKQKIVGLDIKNKAITPALAEGPIFKNIELFAEGKSIDFINCKVVSFKRIFDLQRCLLVSEYLLENPERKLTNITTLFFVSKNDPNYCAQFVKIEPVNYSTELIVKFINYQNTRPDCLPRIRDYVSPTKILELQNYDQIAFLSSEVLETKTKIQIASKTLGACNPFIQVFDNKIEEVFKIKVKKGETYKFSKQTCFLTSYDSNYNSAIELLKKKLNTPFSMHLKAHTDFWQRTWIDKDIAIEGEKDVQLGTRWGISNLVQLGSSENSDISIGATGLHGNGYFGHVFWDTELWIIPFFVATDPQTARNLLLYRYKGLDSARKNAQELGLEGAKFPWTSAQTGIDVTPPDWANISKRELHVSGAVSYAFWNYLQWTGDQKFFNDYGLEVIVETAKYWGSIFKKGLDSLYHLEDVVGPDEYNINVNDNYYTNFLAKWNILKAIEFMDIIKEQNIDIYERIKTITCWDEKLRGKLFEISKKIAFPRTLNGVCEQFNGFFELKDIQKKNDCCYSKPSCNETLQMGKQQISKQADVVMMHYLFPDEFNEEIKKASYKYFKQRCVHGSSLSPSVFCIVGQRVGDYKDSYEYFKSTALQDLKNLHPDKNLLEGIHVGCAGGTWKSIVFGFAGISIQGTFLSINPVLPRDISSIQFTIKFQSRKINFRISHHFIKIILIGEQLEILLQGKKVILNNSQEYVYANKQYIFSANKTSKAKGVIFDLDGVIVNTAKFHYLAWKDIADKQKVFFNEEVNENLKGVSREESIKIILQNANRYYSPQEHEKLAKNKNDIYLKLLEKLKPENFTPNIKTLVKLLKERKIKTGIYSVSKNTNKVLAKLDAQDLFDVVVTGNDIKHPKPDPEGFLMAAEKLKLSPEECLVIEDALAGVTAAKNAQMKSIGIGDKAVLCNADVVFTSVNDLHWEKIESFFA